MRARHLLPVVALLLLVGCETEDPDDTVGMRDNFYEPEHLTVEAGTAVTFDNFGQVPHNAIDVEGTWSTDEVVAADESDTVTIDAPGTYTYYCSFHAPADGSAGMVGTLTVVEDGEAAEPEETGGAAWGEVEAVEPTGRTRHVPDDHPTIQSGVDAAEPGDLWFTAV